ncbi:MAG: hypothetical protein AB3N14_21080 [Flavobacteriaceae bacterium]
MKRILLFLPLFICSCIPLKTAPRISDYRITTGNEFEKGLSDRTMFLFQDPKDAGEFYDFVNTRFQLNHENVYDDVPFLLNGDQYFFAFYEIEQEDKMLNLFPALLTMALDPDDGEYFEGDEISRNGRWYLAIEVYSDAEKDCLEINSLSRAPVLEYLRSLKSEYLSTDNYDELVLEN